MKTLAEIPLQGQLVTVRHRRYVVTNVIQGTHSHEMVLPDGVHARAQRQHVVTLASVEDDALGEELQVLWEMEPGARVIAKDDLPDPAQGFDAPEQLDTFLQAVRWGAASNAEVDTLQAPFRSGVVLEDYQLDPVARAIKMPRVNLLIADDVGLGKTIEAGLVCQELILRHRARTVLVICPASLQVQWRDQMRAKFGLEFRIVDSQLMSDLRRQQGIHANPWTHFPRLITSLEFFRRDRPLRLFREELPASVYPRKFDLLIVDEAHNIAPAGRGHYAVDSLSTKVIREITPHFEHKLFLTATPHNGYSESFTALLELLDNQRFARTVGYQQKQLDTVMIRRLKSEMKDWENKPRFPGRFPGYIPVHYSDTEREAHRWLQQYTRKRLTRQHTDATERFASEFVLKLLKKRLFSSPAAFEQTLARHRNSLEHAQRHTPSFRPTVNILAEKIAEIEEEYDSDAELDTSVAEAVDVMTPLFQPPDAEEQHLLDEMQRWAEQTSKRSDSKARELLDWLKTHIRPNGTWSDERVIIFTEYRTTQDWLEHLMAGEHMLEEHGQKRTMLLYGGMPSEVQEEIKAAFQADPAISPVRILLATDAASEGIDLQNYCSQLIHYEIPWNPNRLEQRNGRIDRHGQRNDVHVYHFVSDRFNDHNATDTSLLHTGELDDDLEFVMRILRKVDVIRHDLGKVGTVIADEVEEVMLGKKRDIDLRENEKRAHKAKSETKLERDIRKRCEELYKELLESRRTLNMTAQNVQRAVETALKLDGELPLVPRQLPGKHGAPPIEVFDVPVLRGSSWKASIEGLPHPYTNERRPVLFDHDLASGRDDVVLAHLNHPLVDMALRLLRAAIWSPQGNLHRVTARVVPNIELAVPVVIAHARLMILGGRSQRLHEELIYAGGELHGERFERIPTLRRMDELLRAASSDPIGPTFQQHLAELWPHHREPLFRALEARKRDRRSGLDKILTRNEEQDIKNMTELLHQLEDTIRDKLKGQDTLHQLSFLEHFDHEERRQHQRDLEALRERLAHIAEEITQETQAIRELYAQPRTHLFPVAVTYLVPARMAY